MSRHPVVRRSLAAAGLALLSLLGGAASAQAPGKAPAPGAPLKATLLVLDDDPRLERNRRERAYLGHPGGPAAEGLKLALEEGRFELEAAGVAVALDNRPVRDLAALQAAAVAAEKAGAAVLVTDLPADWTLAASDAVKIPVLNVGEASDRLRQQDCRANLFHLIPSERQRADSVAQTLLARKWSKVLVLTGPSPEDQTRAAVAQASLKRYGLQVVATKPFKLSADPRERDLANPLLLTAGTAYDVVWVVDSDGELARSLPYRTVLPRPVVGDGGLVATAWHAQYERFGAPQVVRRFAKAYQRPMTGHDWAAWMAGKALVTAAVAAPKGPWAPAIARVQIDGSKGVTMSFRAWDGQLRQPLLLTDGEGVISTAPIEGVLHPVNALDAIGADAGEKLCKAPR